MHFGATGKSQIYYKIKNEVVVVVSFYLSLTDFEQELDMEGWRKPWCFWHSHSPRAQRRARMGEPGVDVRGKDRRPREPSGRGEQEEGLVVESRQNKENEESCGDKA